MQKHILFLIFLTCNTYTPEEREVIDCFKSEQESFVKESCLNNLVRSYKKQGKQPSPEFVTEASSFVENFPARLEFMQNSEKTGFSERSGICLSIDSPSFYTNQEEIIYKGKTYLCFMYMREDRKGLCEEICGSAMLERKGEQTIYIPYNVYYTIFKAE